MVLKAKHSLSEVCFKTKLWERFQFLILCMDLSCYLIKRSPL